MSLLKLARSNAKNILVKYSESQVLYITFRKLSIVPSIYDCNNDPTSKFFSPGVQVLLKRLTRPDFAKVFRNRKNNTAPILKTPVYKFLTDAELAAEVAKADKTADRLLQMPPVVKVREEINDVLSKDPALTGYDTAKYVFTDITFGVANEKRIVVERDPDGTLQSSNYDIRKRLNQIYFPIQGRKIREPTMFSDVEKFTSLLERQNYEFVLDRACIQYEPDDPAFQKITSITYQHVDSKSLYNLLRSTRHFGPLAFYLAWHQCIDSLMLELIQTGAVREGVLLIALRHAIQNDIGFSEEVNSVVSQIIPTPVQLTRPEKLSEEDIQLDNKCVNCLDKYIVNNSVMRSQQELALQGFKEDYQQLVDMNRGLKKAHGAV